MRKLTVILDAGHGGVIDGQYQTAGKRSPKWSRGVLYEGMFNRWVVNRIIEKLDRANIPYYHLAPELTDTSLKTRVKRANKIYKEDRDTYILSIHANAGGGKGIEGFTTKGNTRSDAIGEMFMRTLIDRMDRLQNFRVDTSDGDLDKEANFYILRKPAAPAFLLEAGFMDHQKDYANLWDENYLSSLVQSLFLTIKQIYENGVSI